MTKIIIAEDCGNSPKNLFLQKLTIAFAKVEAPIILDSITEDFRWNLVGRPLVQGKAEFAKVLAQMSTATELTILHVATHGKAGAVNGILKMKSGKVFSFCDVYEFASAKGTRVKEITAYVIEIE